MKLYEKDGFSLRPLEDKDLPRLTEHRNDPETWVNLTSSLPVWPHKQEDFLNSLGNNSMYFIGIGGTNAGPVPQDIALIRLTDIDWVNRNACVGLDIFKPWRGKGYGHEFFNLIVDYAFKELNLNRLWLLVLDTNEPAKKIYLKAGFAIEGAMHNHIYRNGKYHDYILMGKVRSDTSV